VLLAPNRAIRIDPATYEAVEAVPVGTDPVAAIGGGGSLWVANRRSRTVSMVDPASNRVQETMPVSGSGPDGRGGPGLAYASGSLWVANTAQGRVVRTEPGADPTPIPLEGASPVALVAAQDTVWVAARTQRGRGLVARIDTGANQAVPAAELPSPPTGLAITPDGQTLWVATAADRAIRRIDTAGGGKMKRIDLTLAPDQAVFGDDSVWVTSRTGDAVLRIDATSSKVEATIRVGDRPTGIAFGADRVWVANGQDGTVSTIDPQTRAVGTMRLGFQPTAVAVMERAVWVALAA
jgi:YVTN family beta-propeller protein